MEDKGTAESPFLWETTLVLAALALTQMTECDSCVKGRVVGKRGPGCVVIQASDVQQPIMSEDHMITPCLDMKLCKTTPTYFQRKQNPLGNYPLTVLTVQLK